MVSRNPHGHKHPPNCSLTPVPAALLRDVATAMAAAPTGSPTGFYQCAGRVALDLRVRSLASAPRAFGCCAVYHALEVVTVDGTRRAPCGCNPAWGVHLLIDVDAVRRHARPKDLQRWRDTVATALAGKRPETLRRHFTRETLRRGFVPKDAAGAAYMGLWTVEGPDAAAAYAGELVAHLLAAPVTPLHRLEEAA